MLLEDSSLDADGLILQSNAFGQSSATGATGGNVEAGSSQVSINGDSTVNVTNLSLFTEAITSFGGTAEGGAALLELGFPTAPGAPIVNITNVTLDADAIGGQDDNGPINAHGEVLVQAFQGTLTIDNLVGTAIGDAEPAFEPGTTGLIATGGDIIVNDLINFTTFADFVIETGQGSIIGGPTIANPTVSIGITTDNSIIIVGDNDNAITFGSPIAMAPVVDALGDPDAPVLVDVHVGRVVEHRGLSPERDLEVRIGGAE